MLQWFDVSKEGLADLVERRGKAWILYELISNAWDEKATQVSVTVAGAVNAPRGRVMITVTDDNPDGFADLRDAWTLFAPSKKKGDAERRGRFSLGEKLVLAMCEEASIRTTTGGVVFDKTGRHNRPSLKTTGGSVIECLVKMTLTEVDEMVGKAFELIPPPHITTTINGKVLEEQHPIAGFPAQLPTEIADGEGKLRRTVRSTTVLVYKPREGEKPMIYELGIPVVETGDAFHVNVLQKVPLNMERDNVTPAYLRDLRALVLTHTHALLSEETKRAAWVTDAIAAPSFTDTEALSDIITARFGVDRVAYDPSDREANDLAVTKGYKVVHGGSLPAEVWAKAREANLIKPAGQVTPSPKPFHTDGVPLKMLPVDEMTMPLVIGVGIYRWIGKKLLGFVPEVSVANDPGWPFRAAYGDGKLILNYAKLGDDHFKYRERIYRLAIHEYGHHFEPNHLSEKFHEACCDLGAKLAAFFDEFGGGKSAIVDDMNMESYLVAAFAMEQRRA